MTYVPLNIKTNYDLLQSVIKIPELIRFCKQNKITSIAITDENMFATLEFYKECKINDIRPIIGSSVILENTHIYIYCKNYEGYKNLCKIITQKNLDTLTLDFIKDKSENLKFVLDFTNLNKFTYLNKYISELFVSYKNKKEKLEILLTTDRIVYLNEVVSLYENDLKYVKYLRMIKDGKVLSDEINYNIDGKYLNLEIDTMDKETTNFFAKDLNLEFPEFTFSLPIYDEKKDSILLLKSLCKKGLEKRLKGKITYNYLERLKYELSIIEKMGYVDYFLIVYDFILYAKKQKILVGPGRGSAAGSLVSFVLGITDIDPLKYNLIFERFLNPERITMPDIDSDFEYLRRAEVIEYVREKYGYDKVANIITFGTLLPKQVLRDVGRVLELETNTIDKLCKNIKDKDTFSDLKDNESFMHIINSESKLQKLLEICKKFEGLKRQISTHAAGVVISDKPLNEKMPLIKSGSQILTCYSMEYIEEMGLLKMDFLGLRNLTIIDNIIKLVNKNIGIQVQLNEIDYSDEGSLKIFYNAETVGIFQFESSGMKGLLRKLKVKKFEDIIDALALYRPGPRESIDLFIARREGRKKIEYIVPELEPILKSTNGIIIYQEQLLEILREIAGYSYAEADLIRRAISKKKEDVILSEKAKFVSRCRDKNISKEKSLELFSLISKFANYGFNKSHAVAYAIVSFWMAYLKSHYKEYFMTALLNYAIGSDVTTKEYIDEIKTMNLYINKPDVNLSKRAYYNINNKIIFPLNIIRDIGFTAVNNIIDERENNGEYKSFFDFIKRTYTKGVNKKIIERLIDSDSFSSFGYNKKTLYENIENAINYANLCKDLDSSLVVVPEMVVKEEFSKEILMQKEYDSFGFYLSMHPVTRFKRGNMVILKNIENYFDRIVNLIVLVEKVKKIVTKNKEQMAFVTVSDEYKKIECVLFPKVFNNSLNLKKGNIIKITGRVEKRMSELQIVVNEIEILNK